MVHCHICKSKQSIAGDCHISCINPPRSQLQVGSGGEERYEIAEKISIDKQAVVRCIWPGSGLYPLCFDGNTVFGCCNFTPKTDKED